MTRPRTSQRDIIGVFGSAAGVEEVEELTPSVLGGWMGMGPRVGEFERRFGDRLGAGFVMLDCASNALHAAVAALELPPRSEVVVPALTFVACANAVALCGHQPVFCDVDLETQNVRAEDVERVLTSRTAAVMVVHYAGKPVRLDEFASFDLPVIEDAAHAVDSTLCGAPCGTLGTVGVFSFDSMKNLASPDGGGLTSPSDQVLDRVRTLRYCGIRASGFARAAPGIRWWEQDVAAPFPRALPNDVGASIALVQLDRLAVNQRRRQEIWNAYQRELAEIAWLALPVEPAADERHSYFTYLVRVLDGRRDALAGYLLERGVYTTLRFYPLHLSSVYGSSVRLPNCETLAEQGLNLPLHPSLSDEEVERVIDAVLSF
jgi:dTDP-4-amino-4,6-dideoxygalactose transaminase